MLDINVATDLLRKHTKNYINNHPYEDIFENLRHQKAIEEILESVSTEIDNSSNLVIHKKTTDLESTYLEIQRKSFNSSLRDLDKENESLENRQVAAANELRTLREEKRKLENQMVISNYLPPDRRVRNPSHGPNVHFHEDMLGHADDQKFFRDRLQNSIIELGTKINRLETNLNNCDRRRKKIKEEQILIKSQLSQDTLVSGFKQTFDRDLKIMRSTERHNADNLKSIMTKIAFLEFMNAVELERRKKDSEFSKSISAEENTHLGNFIELVRRACKQRSIYMEAEASYEKLMQQHESKSTMYQTNFDQVNKKLARDSDYKDNIKTLIEKNLNWNE